MTIPFLKMHGLGNDFVVIDARRRALSLEDRLIRALADRRRGIGCDQVILIGPSRGKGAAFVRFWNPDGSEAGACGNGTRCIGAYLMAETKAQSVGFETPAGLLTCNAAPDGLVTADMGAPQFDWQAVPLAERMDTRTLDLKLGPIDAPVLAGPSAVSMGNPHCVFFVDRLEAYDITRIGPLVENHPLFPERTNVSLAQILAPDRLRLRVWERGLGLSEACGSAACAAVVTAARRKLAHRDATVELDGGPLHIVWNTGDDHVYQTGPTALAFRGEFDPAAFSVRRLEPVS